VLHRESTIRISSSRKDTHRPQPSREPSDNHADVLHFALVKCATVPAVVEMRVCSQTDALSSGSVEYVLMPMELRSGSARESQGRSGSRSATSCR
jgi:hypothetical protein